MALCAGWMGIISKRKEKASDAVEVVLNKEINRLDGLLLEQDEKIDKQATHLEKLENELVRHKFAWKRPHPIGTEVFCKYLTLIDGWSLPIYEQAGIIVGYKDNGETFQYIIKTMDFAHSMFCDTPINMFHATPEDTKKKVVTYE